MMMTFIWYIDDEEGRKKKDKGKKAFSVVLDVEDDMSTEDEDDELQLPESMMKVEKA